MSEPKEISKGPVLIGTTTKAVAGGELHHASKALGNHQKTWAKLNVATSGEYVVQVKLPNGTVEDLATVRAVVPPGVVAKIAVKVVLNVEDGDGGE